VKLSDRRHRVSDKVTTHNITHKFGNSNLAWSNALDHVKIEMHRFDSITVKENFLKFVEEVVNKRYDSTPGKATNFAIISLTYLHIVMIVMKVVIL